MERGGWVASSLGEQGDFLPTSTVTPAIINQEETHVLTSNIQICTIDTQHSLVPRSTLPSLMWPGSEAEVCSLVPRSTLPPLVWPGSEAEVCSLVPRSLALTLQKAVFEMRLQIKGSLFTNNVGCVPVSERMC